MDIPGYIPTKYFRLGRLLLLSAWIGTLPALAGDLCGRITDPSGAPVPGATVAIYHRDNPSRLATAANGEGEYCYHGLAPGNYLVEAQAAGLGTSAASLVRIPAGGEARLDIPLALAKVTTRVLVTAAGAPQSADEVSKAAEIIDAAQLDRRAEFTIAEALRLAPGVLMHQLGGPGSLARVQMRGLRALDTSVLFDGFRFRDAAAPQGDATAFLSDLLVVNTDRVEVLRGSGSSLYGTNASAGVVHIFTDQGGGAPRGALEAEGGGLGLVRGLAKIAGGARGDRLQYTAGLAHLNVTRGVDGDDRTRNSSGQGFAQLRLGPASTLAGRLFTSNSFLQLNDNPYAAPAAGLPSGGSVPAIPLAPDELRLLEAGRPYQLGRATYIPSLNDPDSRRVSSFFSGMLAYTQRLSADVSLRIGYQGLVTRRDARDGPAGVRFEPLFNSSTEFNSRTDIVEARADVRAGRLQSIAAGYEFEREHYDNASRDWNPDAAQRVNVRSQISQRSHSLFAQDQLRLLGDRLQVSLSGRLQRFHLSRPWFFGGIPLYTGVKLEAPPNAYTGDGSVAYFLPRSGTKLRAHAGNGYRAPSLYERFGSSFFFGAFSPYGDPRLRPERAISIDAGFDQYLASSRLRLGATYFYTRLQEVIFFDFSGIIEPGTDPYGRFGGYRNTGGGLARGVELSLEASPVRSLRINSSYTFTNARERYSSVLDGSLRSFFIPDHMFTLTATQQIRRRFDVAFDLAATSSYTFPLFAGFGSRAFRFDGPVKADLVAAYTRPLSERHSLRFYTRLENILNRTYFEEGFRTPGAWATAGLKLIF